MTRINTVGLVGVIGYLTPQIINSTINLISKVFPSNSTHNELPKDNSTQNPSVNISISQLGKALSQIQQNEQLEPNYKLIKPATHRGIDLYEKIKRM